MMTMTEQINLHKHADSQMHADSQCIFDRFLAIASSTAFSCCSSSSRRDDVMLWRLALAALELVDHAADCELVSGNCDAITEVFGAIMPAACRAAELSVLAAMLREDSFDSAATNTINSVHSDTHTQVQNHAHKHRIGIYYTTPE